MNVEYQMFCWLLFMNGLFLGGRLARLAHRNPVVILVLSLLVLIISFSCLSFTYNPGQATHADTLGRVLDAAIRLVVPAAAYSLADALISVYRNSKRKRLATQVKQGLV